MTQYEGSTLGVLRLDGSTACVVSQQGVTTATSLHAVWGPQGDLLIPSGGAYAASGLFVGPAAATCSEQDIAAGIHEETASFEAAAWSSDGEWIAASMLSNAFESTETTTLLLLRRDGSETRTLVDAGFNLWPLFSPDGSTIYFIRSEEQIDQPKPGKQGIWRYDLHSGAISLVADIPNGWSARPRAWTDEGYLVLDVYAGECGYYWTCGDRVVLLDVASGGVVYASAASDFTNYLGFLP
jgi:hypothetical protein